MGKRLYLREEHGLKAIFCEKKAFLWEYSLRTGGTVHIFRGTKTLMRHLYGFESTASHQSYFKLGSNGALRPRFTSVLDAFKHVPGIDLDKRGGEVSKILFRCYGERISRLPLDNEDVLQEVYKGILTRNLGTCPWDPSKSSFGHYVHMVCGCVLSNIAKKQNRLKEREVVGVRKFVGDSWEYVDAAESSEGSYLASVAQEEVEIGESVRDLKLWLSSRDDSSKADNQVAREIVPFLLEGFKRADIAESLGIDPGKVSRGLNYLRNVASDWV